MEPNIFDYADYREFLRDYYKCAKVTNGSFSYRYFAKKAGFESSNFLYLIIEGKRNLTKDYIPKFATALDLNKKERQYFEALVAFNQAKTPEAKKYYLELLGAFNKNRAGTPITDEQFECLSKWYYPVIRELVALPHFRENLGWIVNELGNRVKIKEVRTAIDTLLRLGLLKRDGEGRLIQADANLTTEEEVKHMASYLFHQQMLTLAKEVLGKAPQEDREVSGVTMAVSNRQFREIKRRIQEFEDDILRYLSHNPDVPEAVFQCNIQLFPVSNNNHGRKG